MKIIVASLQKKVGFSLQKKIHLVTAGGVRWSSWAHDARGHGRERCWQLRFSWDTVDGSKPANQLRLVSKKSNPQDPLNGPKTT